MYLVHINNGPHIVQTHYSNDLTSLKVSKLATHNIGIIWTPIEITTNCSPCLISADLHSPFIGSGSIYQSNFTIRAVCKFSGNGCMYRMALLPELKQALPPQYSKLTKCTLLGMIMQCQLLSSFPVLITLLYHLHLTESKYWPWQITPASSRDAQLYSSRLLWLQFNILASLPLQWRWVIPTESWLSV